MDLIEVARLDEARQARALRESAPQVRPFGGGVAARGHPGSSVNSVIGAGLSGPVAERELQEVVGWYEGAGIETRLDLSQFADPGLLAACERMGFVLRGFEVVFFRDLTDGAAAKPVWPSPPEMRVVVVDPANAAQVREHVMVAASGFCAPGTSPAEEDLKMATVFAVHPRTVCVSAVIDGRVVGAGSCEVNDGGVVALFGLSVAPEFRRRGIQQALIAARLNLAMARGCVVATIASRPGAGTERNVRRMGFQAAYTKAVVCRPGAGLAPTPG